MLFKSKITSAALLLSALVAACSTAHGAEEPGKVKPLERFPKASLTIFPVTVFWTGLEDRTEGERAWAAAYERGYRETKARPFAHTLGLLLAEKGYDKSEVANTNFQFPRDKAAREKKAAAFGKFVSELDLKTDYALCTEFTIQAGGGSGMCDEVYSVMVDAKGRIAWEDTLRQRAGTELGCLELARSRLVPAMGLDKLPKKELAEDKRQALREMRAKEPPSRSEFAAIEKRLKSMKQAGASARVLVYPARVGGGEHVDPTSATRLSKLLNEAGLCRATAAKTGPLLEGSGWPNEMQVLWLFARNVREYVREHPADTDYVLFADYWFNPRGQVWAVHFVVCDRAGGWVIVDLQNSHQEEFQRIGPKTLADCDRLVLECLKEALSAAGLRSSQTESAGDEMDRIYESLKITNARTVGGPYAPGDAVTIAYELTNTSNADLKVPLDRSYSRPYNVVGTRQHWIERQGSESTIPVIPPRIRRDGRRYAAGGSIIDTKPTIAAGERLYFTRRVSTAGYPAGKYTCYIEYKRLRGGVIQTEELDFELTGR